MDADESGGELPLPNTWKGERGAQEMHLGRQEGMGTEGQRDRDTEIQGHRDPGTQSREVFP